MGQVNDCMGGSLLGLAEYRNRLKDKDTRLNDEELQQIVRFTQEGQMAETGYDPTVIERAEFDSYIKYNPTALSGRVQELIRGAFAVSCTPNKLLIRD